MSSSTRTDLAKIFTSGFFGDCYVWFFVDVVFCGAIFVCKKKIVAEKIKHKNKHAEKMEISNVVFFFI